MSDRPLVSIVIPCYNSGAYVGEAIESALNQTSPCREVIVVDDGSTDNSLEVIRSFGDRVRLESGPHRGACAARNRGLMLSRGEFIQFLDADDVLLPEKIERCLEAFTPEVDVVFSSTRGFVDPGTDYTEHDPALYRLAKGFSRLFRKESDYRRYQIMPFDPANPLPYLIRIGIGTETPVHRVSCLKKFGGFREDLACAHEYEMHARMAMGGARFKMIDPVLVLWRKHRSSTRITNKSEVCAHRLEIMHQLHERAAAAGTIDPELRAVFATRFIMWAKDVYRFGDRAQARRAFALARSLDRFHRTPAGRLYDGLSWIIGIEPTERLYLWVKNALGRTTEPGPEDD